MIQILDKKTKDKVDEFDSFLNDIEDQLKDGMITKDNVISRVSEYLESGKVKWYKVKGKIELA